MQIKYTIELLTEWHIGSGLGAGAESDYEVLKDINGLPYIPGKTIKGLIRHAANEIAEVQPNEISERDLITFFGDDQVPSKAHFSNAVLPDSETKEILENDLQEYLFKNISSTSIDKMGIADNKSLRTMEVCMPLLLHGSIADVNAECKTILEKTLPWVRHIGTNRNRGLGRCRIKLEVQ